jgi:uncharacterized protein with GYD domain
MATYIVLMNWTEQGIKNVKDSPKRLDAAREGAKKLGCGLGSFFMTIGPYDAVGILEAPNDEALAKFALATGAAGSVRTTTLKAYSEDAYRKIMASL